MTVSAVRPWRRALQRDARFPASVFGPVLGSALRRLASICHAYQNRMNLVLLPRPPGDMFTANFSNLLQKLRQLGDVHSNAPCLSLAEQLGRRSPPRLILIIDVADLLPGATNAAPMSSTDQGGGKRQLSIVPSREENAGVTDYFRNASCLVARQARA